MKQVKYEGSKLLFPNGIIAELPDIVPGDEDLMILEDRCFALNNSISSRNIWCFDLDGNKLWEIEPSIWERPYVHVKMDEKRGLIVSDQNGDIYRLDAETGKVSILRADRFGPVNE